MNSYKIFLLLIRKEEMNFGDTHLSPSKSDDSGYGSTESFDDNPVIKVLVFDLKNDYDERLHGCQFRQADVLEIEDKQTPLQVKEIG